MLDPIYGVKVKGSYAWQSILKACRVVRLGSRWRIGDGKSVLIRGDKWLPDLYSSCVISPQQNLPNNTQACALIDEENGKWIEDEWWVNLHPMKLLLFSEYPSSNRAEDKLICTATPNGCYSTKSAYHLLSTEVAKKIPGPSNTTAHKKFWLDIWQLKVPNKVQHFIWRAANESLPTKKNLWRRNITANALCDRCSSETEDTIHAIWGCAEVKLVWWELERCRPFLSEKLVCFRDLFQGILGQNILHLAELFAYISLSIWYNRNAQRVGTTAVTLGRIYSDAVDRLHEFQMAQDNSVQQQVVAHPTHWLPPPPNQYKASCDGAIFKDSGMAGLGVVVRLQRDGDSTVIGAHCFITTHSGARGRFSEQESHFILH